MKTTNCIRTFLCVLTSLLCLTDCDIIGSSQNYEETVEEFGDYIVTMNSCLEDFVNKTQAYETANFYSLSAAEIKKIVSDYVSAGNEFVSALEAQIELQEKWSSVSKTKSTTKADEEVACGYLSSLPFDVGNVSPAAAKEVADMVSETHEEAQKIEKTYAQKIKEEGEAEASEWYVEEYSELRNKQLKKGINWGFGALVGAGAATVTGVALGVTSAPVLVTLGAVTLVGTAAGAGATWLCSWYTGTKGVGCHYMTTGKTTVGGHLPTDMIPEGSDVWIQVGSYAPLVIENFQYPKDGMERTYELPLVYSDEISSDSELECCAIDTELVADSCDDIVFVTGVANPANPEPYQGVTVTATITPVIADCEITFHIIGTDGYSKTETKTTNSWGKASFGIPGGSSEVYDKVTITTCNGKQYIVTYTF